MEWKNIDINAKEWRYFVTKTEVLHIVPLSTQAVAISTLLNEQGWSPDAIERQLCHMPRDQVRAAYNRAQYLDERRRMMQSWADYLDGLKNGALVIPFKKA